MATKLSIENVELRAEVARLELALLNSDARVKRLHIIIAKRYSGEAEPSNTEASNAAVLAKIAESMARRAALRAKRAEF
jgi:hypothetical protein